MKALSCKYPHIGYIADDRKKIETRKWTTKFRGPILFVVSQRFDYDQPWPLHAQPLTVESSRGMAEEFYRNAGKALLVADVTEVRPMTKQDEKLAMYPCEDGRSSWFLDKVRVLPPALRFPVKGKLGLFDVEVPAEVQAYLDQVSTEAVPC